jgi:hypothetical protein
VFDRNKAALVITDPQIDFLGENGAAYGVFAESIAEQGTVLNLRRLMSRRVTPTSRSLSPLTTIIRTTIGGSSMLLAKASCTSWACLSGKTRFPSRASKTWR